MSKNEFLKHNKYIDLKINGRLFPTWILANFKQYKLPDVLQYGTDPCNSKVSSKEKLKEYQLFIGKYMNFNSPYKNILLYHGVGSGKTVTTINIYNLLYSHDPNWNVYILLKATLKNSVWIDHLNKWIHPENKKDRLQNIHFISYDAPNADKLFVEQLKNADASKKSIYIIEEAHNFIRNVYSNVSTRKGHRAQVIYDMILQDKRDNPDTRVILLSGTPAYNKPFELALLFNLLRPNIFPKNEIQFEQEYVTQTTSEFKTLHPAKKNMFQRRIMGLVSYYIGTTAQYYASKTIDFVDVSMSKYQENIYNYFEEIEEKIAMKNKKHLNQEKTYRTYTRQASDFVFPMLSDGIGGELRPRPHNFKIIEKDETKINHGFTNIQNYNAQKYIESLEHLISLFDEFVNSKLKQDEEKNYTVMDDYKLYHDKYNENFNDFNNDKSQKSETYKVLYDCSPKMLAIIFNIFKSQGPVIVFSSFVIAEGLRIFKTYLHCFGFSSFIDIATGKEGFRYTEYHGGIDDKTRKINLTNFNHPDNIHGNIIKILLISSAGSEGLNTINVRQVHIMEPYWQEVTIIQTIGRAVRYCSHKMLPLKDRHVDVYRYKSIRKEKQTTDQYIENIARGKEGLLQSFENAMKEVAVDCVLNKTHNSQGQDIKCFQFEEKSLFDDIIKPAYKEDPIDDKNMDNGSNSLTSKVIRIKIIKIKAVIVLDKNGKYSESENYWYNPQTRIVYDFDLQYPIGKIAHDDNNIPIKLDDGSFVISKMIPIPIISK